MGTYTMRIVKERNSLPASVFSDEYNIIKAVFKSEMRIVQVNVFQRQLRRLTSGKIMLNRTLLYKIRTGRYYKFCKLHLLKYNLDELDVLSMKQQNNLNVLFVKKKYTLIVISKYFYF